MCGSPSSGGGGRSGSPSRPPRRLRRCSAASRSRLSVALSTWRTAGMASGWALRRGPTGLMGSSGTAQPRFSALRNGLANGGGGGGGLRLGDLALARLGLVLRHLHELRAQLLELGEREVAPDRLGDGPGHDVADDAADDRALDGVRPWQRGAARELEDDQEGD